MDQDHKKKPPQPPPGFSFIRDTGGLGLCEEGSGLVLRINLASPELIRRGRKSWKGEALVRAIGRRPGRVIDVLDATGGLGRDAFIIALHGCRVRLCEKNPLLYALLDDGLARAKELPECAAAVARMTIFPDDSIEFMRNLTGDTRPATVYLDPMYPERRKSARVKKEMQILHKICGPAEDEAGLLAAALACAASRVVVKRPKSAPTLPGPRPHTAIKGSAHRFDIYLKP